MSVAQEKDTERDLYERFEPKEDTLFFRIGEGNLICFHGNTCQIRKRMSEEQRASLLNDSAFFRVSGNCFVNLKRITDIDGNYLCFEEKTFGDTRIPVSKRIRDEVLKRMQKVKRAN